MIPETRKNNENVEEKTPMNPEGAEERLRQTEKGKCESGGGSNLEDLDLSDENIEELKKIFGDIDLLEVPVKEMMINVYREIFDSNELQYVYEEEDDVIVSDFSIDCKPGYVRVVIEFGDDDVSVKCCVPLKATKDVRPAVMEYITRANYGLENGAFEMDLSDGEVVYRTYVNCEDMVILPRCIALNSITIGNRIMKKYGNGLVMIMMGFSDPVTEIEKAEKDILE